MGEGRAEHDLSTPEGIRGRADELRGMYHASPRGFQECLDHFQTHGSIDKATSRQIMAKHGIPDEMVDYQETQPGTVFPVLSLERYERASTALGQKTDQWLDTQLVTEQQECEKAGQVYADADKAYMAADGVEASVAAFESRDHARVALNEARSRYYEKKRGLMGELRESGEELDWTAAGTSTPARVNDTIQASATFLPKDWIAASNRLSSEAETATRGDGTRRVLPVRVRESTTRNHYVEHRYITRRETKVRQSFYSEDLAKTMKVENSPRFGVVPREEWSKNERKVGSSSDVLVREYHVASGPSWFSNSPGVGALDDDGNFRLTGRAAAGWEQHTYTDRDGETQTCWRKPMTRTLTNRQYGMAELTIPKGSSRKGGPNADATHELIHRCENVNPTLPLMEHRFLVRRTTNEDGTRESLQKYTPNNNTEKVRSDDFIDRYVGKDYGTRRFHEVMSVGSEAAFHGTVGGFGKVPDASRAPGRRDDDHHAFVLGAYLTA